MRSSSSSLGRRIFLWIFLAAFFLISFHCVNRSSQLLHARKFASYWREWETFPKGSSKSQPEEPKVAICLVGGARAFELTGPSIVSNILNAYNNSYLFLHAPLDKDAFKLLLLADSNSTTRFASTRIYDHSPVSEQEFHKEVLTSSGSPNGIQGLLQYFRLVEGCWDLITAYENQTGITFDWILRTRLDGYWSDRVPPLSRFPDTHYTIPYGSEFGGFNDRLGIGTRESSRAALQRLTSLGRVHEYGYRQLNSERAFKAQLRSAKVKVQLNKFPFCVLSTRTYAWPPTQWGVPVMALSSRGPLNGAKCRPCRPKAVGREAQVLSDGVNRGWGWSGPSESIELCDARGEWESDWRDVFDRVSGPEGRKARRRVDQMEFKQCVERLGRFERLWDVWEAPAVEVICNFTEF